MTRNRVSSDLPTRDITDHMILMRMSWVTRLSFYLRSDLTYYIEQMYITCFCQLRIDDDRWYWQLYFGSELTIVSLLCLTMVLYTILYMYLDNG